MESYKRGDHNGSSLRCFPFLFDSEAVVAFRSFLGAAGEEQVLQNLTDRGAWGQLKSPNYQEGAHIVTE